MFRMFRRRFSSFIAARVLASAAVLALPFGAASCSSGDADDGASTPAPGPYYRFWQGWKRADVSKEAFHESLNREFIPTAPRDLGDKGLLAYHVVIPPAERPSFIPDQIALLVYRSEDIYRTARATPEGLAYGDAHWALFERTPSKSAVPRSFSKENPQKLEPGEAYDLREISIDWQKGHSVVHLGIRKADVPTSDFMVRMASHLRLEREAFEGAQIGYLVLVTADHEIAFSNWTSEAAMTAALDSEMGKAVKTDADSIMNGMMWTAETDFTGDIRPGDHENVRFAPR